MGSLDIALDRMLNALDHSVSLDRDRWLALNESANLLLEADDVEAYFAAQGAFRTASRNAFGNAISLFDTYPISPLIKSARVKLQETLLEARTRYHARNAAEGEKNADLYGLIGRD